MYWPVHAKRPLFSFPQKKEVNMKPTYYRARDAPWQLNNKTKRVVLCVWISVHRKRLFFHFRTSMHRRPPKGGQPFVGINQPTALHRKQELYRQHDPDSDAEAQRLHRTLYGQRWGLLPKAKSRARNPQRLQRRPCQPVPDDPEQQETGLPHWKAISLHQFWTGLSAEQGTPVPQSSSCYNQKRIVSKGKFTGGKLLWQCPWQPEKCKKSMKTLYVRLKIYRIYLVLQTQSDLRKQVAFLFFYFAFSRLPCLCGVFLVK